MNTIGRRRGKEMKEKCTWEQFFGPRANLCLFLTSDFSRMTGQGPKPICVGIRSAEPQCVLGLGLPLKAR